MTSLLILGITGMLLSDDDGEAFRWLAGLLNNNLLPSISSVVEPVSSDALLFTLRLTGLVGGGGSSDVALAATLEAFLSMDSRLAR